MRDLNLVRSLLETFEAMPPGRPVHTFKMKSEHDSMTVLAHLRLMCESGLLDGICDPETGRIYIKSITWPGYDFLDASRNEDVWAKTQDRLKQAGSWTFGLVMDVLKEEAASRLRGLLG